MLLFQDSHNLQPAIPLPFQSGGVPPWHVLAATRSPGGKQVQEHFPTTKIVNRRGLAVLGGGQSNRGEWFPHFKGGTGQGESGETRQHRSQVFNPNKTFHVENRFN
jgi:hypothetical protein